jgi:hypothetical protein
VDLGPDQLLRRGAEQPGVLHPGVTQPAGVDVGDDPRCGGVEVVQTQVVEDQRIR